MQVQFTVLNSFVHCLSPVRAGRVVRSYQCQIGAIAPWEMTSCYWRRSGGSARRKLALSGISDLPFCILSYLITVWECQGHVSFTFKLKRQKRKNIWDVQWSSQLVFRATKLSFFRRSLPSQIPNPVTWFEDELSFLVGNRTVFAWSSLPLVFCPWNLWCISQLAAGNPLSYMFSENSYANGVQGLFWNMAVNLTAHGAGEECPQCPSTIHRCSVCLCCPRGSFYCKSHHFLKWLSSSRQTLGWLHHFGSSANIFTQRD